MNLEEIINASKAASLGGNPELAIELLDNAKREILGRLWCDVEGVRWEHLDKEAVLKHISRLDDFSRHPGDLLVRAVVAAAAVRDLSMALERMALEHAIQKSAMAKTEPYRLHVYDSIGHVDERDCSSSRCMFTSVNVGDEARCNLQIAGELVSDGSATLTRLSVSRPLDGVIQIEIGGRIVFTSRIEQVYKDPPPLFIAYRSRTCFRVRIKLGSRKATEFGKPFFVYIDGWAVAVV